jgi:hypothetical protein
MAKSTPLITKPTTTNANVDQVKRAFRKRRRSTSGDRRRSSWITKAARKRPPPMRAARPRASAQLYSGARLFAERGYEETTIADLAAAVDIAPRTSWTSPRDARKVLDRVRRLLERGLGT